MKREPFGILIDRQGRFTHHGCARNEELMRNQSLWLQVNFVLPLSRLDG